MEKSNEKYNAIDLFKLIMAVCVIAIHTNPLYECNSKAVISIYNTLVCVANPFFFLSSGYLIGKKYFGGGARQQLYFTAYKKAFEVVFDLDSGLLSIGYLLLL